MFSSMMRISFPQITEAALDVLEVKLMLLTKADITYWFITAAYGVAQAKIASTEPDAQIQWVRDKIAKAYKKIFVSPQKSNGMRTSGEPIPVRTTKTLQRTGLLNHSHRKTTWIQASGRWSDCLLHQVPR